MIKKKTKTKKKATMSLKLFEHVCNFSLLGMTTYRDYRAFYCVVHAVGPDSNYKSIKRALIEANGHISAPVKAAHGGKSRATNAQY